MQSCALVGRVAELGSFGTMKRAIVILGGTALVVFLAWLVWWVGMVFELEYPYTFTLMRVRNAVSVSGVPAAQIIRADGANWSGGLQWHTCSYCADAFGNHKNLTLVRLSAPDKTASYYFAYCRPTHVLMPLMYRTAAQFPSLMPSGDELRPVGELDGTGRTSSFGEGNLELPRKWYRTATGAELGGPANRSQPIRSETNRTSAAAGSGR